MELWKSGQVVPTGHHQSTLCVGLADRLSKGFHDGRCTWVNQHALLMIKTGMLLFVELGILLEIIKNEQCRTGQQISQQ